MIIFHSETNKTAPKKKKKIWFRYTKNMNNLNARILI
jgi:hypothetical protein